jgi:hypothetical protein
VEGKRRKEGDKERRTSWYYFSEQISPNLIIPKYYCHVSVHAVENCNWWFLSFLLISHAFYFNQSYFSIYMFCYGLAYLTYYR